MTDIDELDRMWRDGLASAAEDVVATPNPQARVAARVQHRRRSRRTTTASVVVVLIAAVVIAVSQLGQHPKHLSVGAERPLIVQVTDAPNGNLQILFPGRPISNPPIVPLPSGVIRFEIRGLAPGHRLVIDGVPGFVVDFEAPGTITKDVRLNPGEYLMHCTIPGHAEAGERALLDVTTLTRADVISRVHNQMPGASVTPKFMLFSALRAAVDGGVLQSPLLADITPVWVVEAIGGHSIAPSVNLNWMVFVLDANSGDILASAGSRTTAEPSWWAGLPDQEPS
jgi:hypothetical protein